mmetsp:Transcript_17442/g.24518  ORF Transcript_17442/g.24518 Transcript_17442/m.24518 type:complete len:88 (-) Transcript_17442:773-1036(-)
MAPIGELIREISGESRDNDRSETPFQLRKELAAPVSTSIFTGPLPSSITSAVNTPNFVIDISASATTERSLGTGGLRSVLYKDKTPS